MLTERGQTLDGGYTMQCANDVLQNCAYIILLTNVNHVNSIKKNKDNGNTKYWQECRETGCIHYWCTATMKKGIDVSYETKHVRII